MAISIRNPRAEALAKDVARRTGENMTQAIERALEAIVVCGGIYWVTTYLRR